MSSFFKKKINFYVRRTLTEQVLKIFDDYEYVNKADRLPVTLPLKSFFLNKPLKYKKNSRASTFLFNAADKYFMRDILCSPGGNFTGREIVNKTYFYKNLDLRSLSLKFTNIYSHTTEHYYLKNFFVFLFSTALTIVLFCFVLFICLFLSLFLMEYLTFFSLDY